MWKTIEVPSDALIVLIAPSGAGKSTFARGHFLDTEIVSSDRCRALVSDDEGDQRATGPAFEVFHAILRGRLGMGRLSVADATNLEPVPRQRLLEMARELGRPAVAIVLDVPPDVARARNLARARTVPPHVLDLHYERFRAAREVLATEGFTAIHEVQPGCAVRIVRIDGSP
jgi:protein phosphatase